MCDRLKIFPPEYFTRAVDSLKYMQLGFFFFFSVKGPDRRADKSVDLFRSKRAETHTSSTANDPYSSGKPAHSTHPRFTKTEFRFDRRPFALTEDWEHLSFLFLIL